MNRPATTPFATKSQQRTTSPDGHAGGELAPIGPRAKTQRRKEERVGCLAERVVTKHVGQAFQPDITRLHGIHFLTVQKGQRTSRRIAEEGSLADRASRKDAKAQRRWGRVFGRMIGEEGRRSGFPA